MLSFPYIGFYQTEKGNRGKANQTSAEAEADYPHLSIREEEGEGTGGIRHVSRI